MWAEESGNSRFLCVSPWFYLRNMRHVLNNGKSGLAINEVLDFTYFTPLPEVAGKDQNVVGWMRFI